MQFLNFLGYSQ